VKGFDKNLVPAGRSFSESPLTQTMATCGRVPRMRRTTSLPSIMGILRSVITRSIESGRDLKIAKQLTIAVVIVDYKDHRHTL
jgi:hypothetical protein